jgi:hypothetical protein
MMSTLTRCARRALGAWLFLPRASRLDPFNAGSADLTPAIKGPEHFMEIPPRVARPLPATPGECDFDRPSRTPRHSARLRPSARSLLVTGRRMCEKGGLKT